MNTMINSGRFQIQLASIMGTLTKAAVIEIGKLVDECSTVLRSEISEHVNENEALKKKCYLLELELRTLKSIQSQRGVSRLLNGIQGPKDFTATSTNRERHSPAIDGVFGKDWCINLWREEGPIHEDKETVGTAILTDEVTQAIDLEDNEPELLFVKEEMFEDPSVDKQRGLAGNRKTGVASDDGVGQSAINEPHLYPGDLNTFPMPGVSHGEQGTKQTPMESLMGDPTLAACIDNTAERTSDSADYLEYPTSVNFHATRTLMTEREQKQKFDCLFCGKSFNYLSYLKVHIRRHSGEKPFICTVCGKRFAQKTYLKLHQRTHSGEKPYSCAECGKSFSQKSSLNVHLRSHTGEKPYSCVDCGKSYAYKHGFNQHQCFN